MILNSYAVLVGFVGILRLGLALFLVVLAVRAMLRYRSVASPVFREQVSDRFYLLLLVGVAMFGLNLASWPLLYLLLQSYVTEFPEVMCIYGVTRIGEGSLGPSRHLPTLLAFLQVSKPLLVLVSGGWFAVYLLNRRCATGPSLTESLLLGIGAASAAIVLAFVWLIAFNGYGIAAVFLPGVDRSPGFRVPFRLMPVPVLLTVLVALVIVTSGSLFSTWRTAMAPAREAMR